jgi:hypothetical protein
MFLGYCLDKWVGLGEYFLILVGIGLFLWVLCVQMNKYWIIEGNKRNRLKRIKDIHKKKEIFHDVA